MTRILEPSEWGKFREIFKATFGLSAPEPTQPCIVIITEEEGSITGFAVLQSIVHLEPVWVREDQRKSHNLLSMIKFIEQTNLAPNYLVSHTSNERVASVMEACGLEQLHDYKTFIYRRPA